MNDLRQATITTLEVAEMMEMEHCKIIRKLEGSKDRKGYINILTEAQMGVSDYFIPSTYKFLANDKCPWLIILKMTIMYMHQNN